MTTATTTGALGTLFRLTTTTRLISTSVRRNRSGSSSGSTSVAQETIATPGQFRTVDVVGESILVTRNDVGGLRGSTTYAATVARAFARSPRARRRRSSSARTTHGATT